MDGDVLGKLSQPMGVAVQDDKCFVADNGNHRVCAFQTDSLSFIFSVGGLNEGPAQLKDPCGIAAGSDLVIVADSGHSRCVAFSFSGEPLYQFGSLGSSPGQFRSYAPSRRTFCASSL
jgi:hypothetical protein